MRCPAARLAHCLFAEVHEFSGPHPPCEVAPSQREASVLLRGIARPAYHPRKRSPLPSCCRNGMHLDLDASEASSKQEHGWISGHALRCVWCVVLVGERATFSLQTRWNPQRSPGQPVDRWHGRLPEVPGSVTSALLGCSVPVLVSAETSRHQAGTFPPLLNILTNSCSDLGFQASA